MTDYTIYSYGGGKILWEIFNVLAILFKSDNVYTTSVIKLSLVVGAIWATTFAVFKANLGVFAKVWFAPTFLLLNLMLVPKATIHIIDRVDQNFHYSAVDHVPAGLGLIVALPSMICDGITTIVDELFSREDSSRYTTVGPLFGARLAFKAEDLVIQDATIRKNIKNFMGQCYMLPYIFTNIPPGRDEAMKSLNILEFIKSNSHKSLGSYWEENGKSEFLSCSECAKKVDVVLQAVRTKESIPTLALSLFGSNPSESKNVERQLHRYFDEAWSAMSKESQNIHTVVNQSLLINAYREHLDDKRDEFGANRLDPSLLRITKARASSHQNMSYLTKGLLAGEYIPMLQTIFMAMVMILFVLVLPISFLPGGLKYLSLWVQMSIWVNTWPVFYAVLNGIAQMFLKYSKITQSVSYGGGLSLATQGGLAETSYEAYCWTMGLMMAIPYLSWAFVSKSGYALSQSISGLSDGLSQSAARLVSDSVDGNINFDNQNIGNKSLFGSQIAQQTLGPNINYGESFSDGTLSMHYGPGGSVAGNAVLSNLATSVSFSESDSSSVSTQFTDSYQQLAQNALSYADQIAHGDSKSLGFTSSEREERQKTSDEVKQYAQEFATQNDISTSAAVQAGVGFNAGILSVGGTIEGKDSATLSKALRSSAGKNLTDSLSRLESFAKEDAHNSSDSRTRDHADSFLKQKMATKNWSQIESFNRENSVALQTNATDDVIDYAANSMFSGNKSAAIQWANVDREGFEATARSVMASRSAGLQERVRSVDHVMSHSEIKELYAGEDGLKTSSEFVTPQVADIGGNMKHTFGQMLDTLRNVERHIETQTERQKNQKGPIDTGISKIKDALK